MDDRLYAKDMHNTYTVTYTVLNNLTQKIEEKEKELARLHEMQDTFTEYLKKRGGVDIDDYFCFTSWCEHEPCKNPRELIKNIM